MFFKEFNTIAIVAELVRASFGTSSGAIQTHANADLDSFASRNTISLNASPLDEAPKQEQGFPVDCSWINPFPEGTIPADNAEKPPQVSCEIFNNPSGGLPILRVKVNDWPEGKASIVAFALENSDTVIVTANPNNPSVNLQTVCGVGSISQWFLRGMQGNIFESDDFITTQEASFACFEAVNNLTTITIKDANGIERQVLFDPVNSGHNGNQGAFRPFRRNVYGTNKIYFVHDDEESARTVDAMRFALQHQLEILTNDVTTVWPSYSYANSSEIINYLPLPTPTPEPTLIAAATPEYVAPIEQVAPIIQEMMASPELINYPNINLGVQIESTNDIQIFHEEYGGPELTKYIEMLNTTVDEQILIEQFHKVTHRNFGQWLKSLIGKDQPPVSKMEAKSINISKIMHISFDDINTRKITIDGLDPQGKFIKLTIPFKGDFTVLEDDSLQFDNGLTIRFSALDSNNSEDEAGETIHRLAEQISNYYDIGSQSDTIPEVVVVPNEAVLHLYEDGMNRNDVTAMARSLRTEYPTVNTTFSYIDEKGAQHLIPNFMLPTGMVGTVKQFLLFDNRPIFELNIPLIGDLINGNVISTAERDIIRNQLPAGLNLGNSITIYLSTDNIAAIPGEKVNPYAPIPMTPTVTPTPLYTATPTLTEVPAFTPTTTATPITPTSTPTPRVISIFGYDIVIVPQQTNTQEP